MSFESLEGILIQNRGFRIDENEPGPRPYLRKRQGEGTHTEKGEKGKSLDWEGRRGLGAGGIKKKKRGSERGTVPVEKKLLGNQHFF